MGGRIFIFSGPSGAGKSSISNALVSRVEGVEYSVSYTSRSPRKNEVDGVDYCFVDRDTFMNMINEGAFVEWAKVYDEFYGTSFRNIDRAIARGADLVLDIDPQGARNIKDRFEDAVLIYVLPPSVEMLHERLRHRGTESEKTLQQRLDKAISEIRDFFFYDYIIINSDLEEAVRESAAIVLAERCRTYRRESTVKRLFNL